MKVLYNAQQLIPPLSGIGRYAAVLGQSMSKQKDIKDVKFFSPIALHHKYPNFNDSKHSYSLISKVVRSNPFFHHSTDYILKQYLKFRLRSYKDFIYHETNYNLVPFAGRKIVTIHDLSFVHYREFHPVDRLRFFYKEFSKSLEAADYFITDCQFIKEEVVAYYGIDKSKIAPIYLGVSDNFRPFTHHESIAILTKHGLINQDYILLVGNLEPRKNLENFIDAFQLLPFKQRKNKKIVHVGLLGWQNEGLLSKIKRMEEQGEFHSLGFIPEEELPIIYSNAYLLAFPSVYEGFGFPPLEAMACGTPVFATQTSSITEVVGNAGKLTTPNDVDQMSADLATMLEDDQLRKQYVERGLERVKKFTWAACVKNTMAVYEKVQNL